MNIVLIARFRALFSSIAYQYALYTKQSFLCLTMLLDTLGTIPVAIRSRAYFTNYQFKSQNGFAKELKTNPVKALLACRWSIAIRFHWHSDAKN